MLYAQITWILLLSCAAPLRAEQVSGQPNLVPVKPELLDGTRLMLKSAGCSFDLPAAGWKWMIFDGNAGQNYHCFNASTQANFLIAAGHFHGEFSDEQPKSLIENARKAIAARGGKLESDKFEWIELKDAKKCARVTFVECEKAGDKRLAVFYIIQTIGETSLKLQFVGAASTEPEAFNKMAHSLAKLPETAEPAKK